ncbi:MAG: U32 family peptidase [Peptococcaceae bacterium]|nr:U32 family peptidase [Peptococcaceae bacterium]
MKKPELLAPAGNMEKLKAAVVYGADAVYLGGPRYGLRMGAENFTLRELPEAVDYARRYGVKVYVTVNIFAHNRDFRGLGEYLLMLREAGADGVIVADPGVFSLVRSVTPELKVHLSTQANTVNAAAAAFWEAQGASRIVLARELSLEEIREIRDRVRAELEVFVHGAMCISYSGRCLLSMYVTGRDANLGDCAQPCRWRYALMEEKRPGQYFPVLEDSRGTYILSSRDMCLLSRLPELAAAGVDSFKIEGRVKSVHYVSTVVKVYREAIDRLMEDPGGYQADPRWWDELGKVSNRDYTTGFLSGGATLAGHGDVEGIYRRNCTFVGLVKGFHPDGKLLEVEQRNRFFRGETLEVLIPGRPNGMLKVEAMIDREGRPLDEAPHPRQTVFIPAEGPLPEFSLLRRLE